MPIKIFAAPGDHKDDFRHVESQVNEWIEEARPKVLKIRMAVNQLLTKREAGQYMMTLLVLYERSND